MLRPTRLVLLAAAAAALPTVALQSVVLAGQASTTRIETRNFYGATVTLEAGVRVFRALPYHSKVIINPGGKTPITLGFEENHTFSRGDGATAERGGGRDRDRDGGEHAGNGLVSGGGVAGERTADGFAHRTGARADRRGNGIAPHRVNAAPHQGGGGKGGHGGHGGGGGKH